MKRKDRHFERGFERLTSVATVILGHHITFIIALCTVIFWLTNKKFYTEDLHYKIGDVILGVTFLSFFIIQRAVNKTTTAIRIKINELIASHDQASNDLLAIEEKTGSELEELADEHKSKVNKRTENKVQ